MLERRRLTGMFSADGVSGQQSLLWAHPLIALETDNTYLGVVGSSTLL